MLHKPKNNRFNSNKTDEAETQRIVVRTSDRPDGLGLSSALFLGKQDLRASQHRCSVSSNLNE